jgi:gluconolactonase
MDHHSQDHLIVSDSLVHRLVPRSSKIEKLATGFAFTEGPIWLHDGTLLFSDIPNNSIFRWSPGGEVSLVRKPSGYANNDAPAGAFIGSNGLTLDAGGRLTVCEHGNARVTRLEADGALTVLADRFEGRRLNSPNDAVYHSDGGLYFTDPPYGLVQQDADPKKELDFNGVFRLKDGELRLLFRDLTRPNGLAFSPDESVLYVANSDRARKIWMRFAITGDGGLTDGSVFRDVTAQTTDGVPDGMKIDREGNLYCTGPGGIWIFTPEAKHLGTICFPEIPANLHWGEEDAQTLYVTARTSLYRIKLSVPGIRP